ncbi:hypothetical protein ACFYM0_10565 [Streptomyces sp. NPDC006487]|uniref:hypothetical protein n=1 Tax=Streptomyces sp. NPDC006487 TaxID=3364748 RepID=UPI00368365F0
MKGTHQSQRQTGRSEETARNYWDDFEAVRGQMDRLFGQTPRRTSRAEATSAVPGGDEGRRLG